MGEPKKDDQSQQSELPIPGVQKPEIGKDAASPERAPGDLALLNHPTPLPPNSKNKFAPRNRLDYSSGAAAIAITLRLPSGNTFDSHDFDVDLNAVERDLRNRFDKQREGNDFNLPVFEFGSSHGDRILAERKQGKLDGVLLAYYNSQLTPHVYANYKNNSRDGMIKIWDRSGSPVYWCKYQNGSRQGFYCYFKTGMLRILFENNRGSKSPAVHLCDNDNVVKSFASIAEAMSDKDAKMLIDEWDKKGSELKTVEEDSRTEARKAIAGVTKQMRNDNINRMNQKEAEKNNTQKALMDSLVPHN